MPAQTHNLPILYSFRRCPYAMRARLALLAADLAVELREVDLRYKPEEMLGASPKGSVPVLVLADGTVIDESYDIMKWALSQNDPNQWLAIDLSEANEWVRRNDHEFKKNLDGYKYAEYHPEKTAGQWRAGGEEFLGLVNARLQTHGHICGPAISMVDAAIVPFIRQFVHVDRDWDWSVDYPALGDWMQAWLDSALFKAVMRKYDRWNVASEPEFFNA